MPKLKVFVVYDAKSKTYANPFMFRQTGEALRAWDHAVNNEQSNPARWPEDYTLFEVAEFDETTGRYEQYQNLKPLATALEVKRDSASAPALKSV